MRVVVADDSLLLREGLQLLLAEAGHTVVGSVGDGPGFVEAMLGERFSYTQAMGTLVAAILVVGTIVIASGPEARGVSFRKQPAGAA